MRRPPIEQSNQSIIHSPPPKTRIPVLRLREGTRLQEVERHGVDVVVGQAVQGVEHGGERSQEVLEVVACLFLIYNLHVCIVVF